VAHGDPTYMRVDIDKLLNGDKISTLDEREFKVYMTLWALAVKHRSEVLSDKVSVPEYVKNAAKLGSRRGKVSVSKVLEALHSYGLIELLPSGRINVIGVKEVHAKLQWDKSPKNGPIDIPI
jgi:hypothetical protein